jgi:hypothetical protein
MPRWRNNGPHRVPKPRARSARSGSGINVALDMKAKALRGAKIAEEDPNIAAAMAAAAGTAANATVGNRLAALQQRK